MINTAQLTIPKTSICKHSAKKMIVPRFQCNRPPKAIAMKFAKVAPPSTPSANSMRCLVPERKDMQALGYNTCQPHEVCIWNIEAF
jgi:hypothetical protein